MEVTLLRLSSLSFFSPLSTIHTVGIHFGLHQLMCVYIYEVTQDPFSIPTCLLSAVSLHYQLLVL